LITNASTTRVVFRVGLGLALLTSAALTYLLIRAVDHNSLSDQNIGNLLLLDGLIAAALFIVIVAMAWRLRQRLKEGKFGSKLLMKLAAIFALVGLLPGILIYSVSYQFVSRSIETWFDVRVESALDAGLNLGRTTLDKLSSDLSNKVRAGVPILQLENEAGMMSRLERLREQWGVDDAQIWNQSGLLLASTGESKFQLSPERPTAQQMRSLKTQRSISIFEGLEDSNKNKGARLKVIVPMGTLGIEIASDMRYLVVTDKLPAALVENALTVQTAHREYQERALARSGLQKMYIGTLTLSLFLAVLGAIILAVILGNQLVAPLLVLASGVERVTAGDLSPKLALPQDNELAGLTRAFASMTQQLADAKVAEQKTERVKAWNEVAQRVAHEIKNPLTPIQLSAERLSMKLGDKLQGADLALLEKSVKTIVDQVEAMKRLVNEFRDYGRLPSARLLPISLLSVIQDTLSLYEHELQEGLIRLTAAGFLPNIRGDVEQLRQVIHNLLQNALDSAKAQHASAGAAKQVTIALSVNPEQTWLHCLIEDSGAGFAPHILARAFEPYNTTKPKGTGLGLAVVRKIVQEHHGEITLTNKSVEEGGGARVSLLFPLTKKDVGA
jgi:nitrogen fixation/metabolism regulation signal transduction histidine kinase